MKELEIYDANGKLIFSYKLIDITNSNNDSYKS